MSITMDADLDLMEKQTPFQKLVNSERLSYLPNLYYRQYRVMEMLTSLRADFPAQKVLLPRSITIHDHVLEQARTVQFKLTENVKYRKAICFHLARCAKDEHAKRQYKKEEKNMFHRVVYSQLAEAVKATFDEQVQEVGQTKNGKVVAQNNSKPDKQHKRNDGVFIDNSQNEMSDDMDQGGDLFDDILKDVQPDHSQERVEADLITMIRDYMVKMGETHFEILQTSQRQINRKLCLKKINENLRKRNKTKTEDDSEEKKISSATVAITSLINQEPQSRLPEELIDLPSENDYLVQDVKVKKKKDQAFELKWNEESLETFSSFNPRFQIPKGKFDDSYLSLSVQRQQKSYGKMFDKNINSHKTFPPSLDSIPKLETKFSKNYYYNQLPDPEYEDFIISHSKKKIFEKFRKSSPYILSDTIGQEFEGQNISLAKLFITPDGPYSDRIIYKINNNRLTSISSLPQKSALSREELSQLAYFVRKYLGLFGSNWKLIHLFISIHPSFSQMFLNRQEIQELHQIPKQQVSKNSLTTMQLLDSKVLPFNIYNSFGYDEYNKDMRMEDIKEDMTMEVEEQEQSTEQFNFDRYEAMLDEPLKQHESPKDFTFERTARDYEKFAKGLKFPTIIERREEIIEEIEKVIQEFECKKNVIQVDAKDVAKVTWCYEWIGDRMKNKIKPVTPFRKRKSISERVSELVSILHKLKQRLQVPAVARPPIPPSNSVSRPATINPAVTPQSRNPVSTSQIAEPATNKKMLPRNPSATASKDKPSGPPKHRKPKKKDGKDDDDK